MTIQSEEAGYEVYLVCGTGEKRSFSKVGEARMHPDGVGLEMTIVPGIAVTGTVHLCPRPRPVCRDIEKPVTRIIQHDPSTESDRT
jgi:hypothetical protein